MKLIKKHLDKTSAFIFLTFIGVLWIIPITWTLLSSFKAESEIQTVGYKILPIEWVIQNYIDVLSDTSSAPIVKWFINSLFISTTHTILVLIIASMSAYAYSRLNFKGRDALFTLLLSTMMFPSVVNLIPLYKISDILGWIDNPLSVIVPGLGGVFNIFLIRQFMLGIPKEYDECARVEGANDFQIYTKVILPLIRPVLTVVALFSFTGSWNDFLWPSIVMNDIDKLPLTPGLKLLQGVYDIEIAHLMASAVISIIPTFIIFLFAQRYFLKGLSLSSGVKG
ncbi:carbohydrate ABC transporter permease [Clostridium sp. SYSU_GA19001]|uniref:carbohydrate ABC transporter permease n=1 Tax=Clostridium caldaquaticum TaxID=2940653 RepID=UPI002076E170|nr:carbohydrate ABC transporter permease [Clostridium caldaquaticum]MCM8709686.1 carbohydrate ABC transporter permease [Clostridium caldaquaticum]